MWVCFSVTYNESIKQMADELVPASIPSMIARYDELELLYDNQENDNDPDNDAIGEEQDEIAHSVFHIVRDNPIIPDEILDLVRFMCATWAAIDTWAYRDAGAVIGTYPVIQGTLNQIKLRQIGEQPHDTKRIAAAIQWLQANSR